MCAKPDVYDMNQLDFSYFSEERIIGKGGFGTVYAVRKRFGNQDENEVFYAAKELDKKNISKVKGLPEMTLSELQYMIEISEGFGGKGAKFLMNMECAFQSNSKLYIVQDLMDGGDLHFNMMHRTRRKVFDLERVKWYSACCLLGLEEIHSLNILHRDIKPANMLLDKQGYAKLADFGLCGRLDKDGKCRARGGTLSFMSPESRNKQKKGRHGTAHDYFGLGVMIFVMFTCQYPFSKFGNFNTVIAAHLSEISVGGGEDDDKKKDLNYDEGNGASAGRSSAMMGAALELEQEKLPEHYQLDNKTLRKLPNDDARDLCKKLLMMNEKYRLGYKGAQQVMKHKFFEGIDWEAMKNRTAPPPAKPDTSRASVATGELDLLKLLGSDEGEQKSDPKVSDRVQKMFEDFSYNPYLDHPDDIKADDESASVVSTDNNSESVGTRSNADSTKDTGSGGSRELLSPELIGMSSRNNLSLGLAIAEETLDPRTGTAITSDNPYNNYDPADLATLNEMTPETPIGMKRAKGGFYEVEGGANPDEKTSTSTNYSGTLRGSRKKVHPGGKDLSVVEEGSFTDIK
ncbi:hypothetical protein TL16_g01687 [Triparma laevis f. inornata]|nr:hypothetical protein TL16_g01687 [Triparma laevis f. inornata]